MGKAWTNDKPFSFHSLAIESIDDLRRPVDGAECEIVQIGSGHISGHLTRASVDDLAFSIGSFSLPIRAAGVFSRTRLTIGALLRSSDTVRGWPGDLHPGSISIVPPGADHCNVYSGSASFAGLSVDSIDLAMIVGHRDGTHRKAGKSCAIVSRFPEKIGCRGVRRSSHGRGLRFCVVGDPVNVEDRHGSRAIFGFTKSPTGPYLRDMLVSQGLPANALPLFRRCNRGRSRRFSPPKATKFCALGTAPARPQGDTRYAGRDRVRICRARQVFSALQNVARRAPQRDAAPTYRSKKCGMIGMRLLSRFRCREIRGRREFPAALLAEGEARTSESDVKAKGAGI
jgi:hypothetical protein